MQIKRTEDKKFQLTIDETEAICFSDPTQIDCKHFRVLSIIIGGAILGYMIETSKFPNDSQAALEIEI